MNGVVEEIKSAGGDAIGVSGDVGADDFPEKIVDATVQWVFCEFRSCTKLSILFDITGNMGRLTTL